MKRLGELFTVTEWAYIEQERRLLEACKHNLSSQPPLLFLPGKASCKCEEEGIAADMPSGRMMDTKLTRNK